MGEVFGDKKSSKECHVKMTTTGNKRKPVGPAEGGNLRGNQGKAKSRRSEEDTQGKKAEKNSRSGRAGATTYRACGGGAQYRVVHGENGFCDEDMKEHGARTRGTNHSMHTKEHRCIRLQAFRPKGNRSQDSSPHLTQRPNGQVGKAEVEALWSGKR